MKYYYYDIVQLASVKINTIVCLYVYKINLYTVHIYLTVFTIILSVQDRLI